MEKTRKRNKVIIVLLICIVVIGSAFGFIACSDIVDYEIFTLQDAYEQGLIDYDDLLNIAYYKQGRQFNEDLISEDFSPKKKDELTLFEELDIKKSLANNSNKNIKNIFDKKHLIEIEILSYYGKYNGYIVFTYTIKSRDNDSVDGLMISTCFIDEVKFQLSRDIYLWKKI